MEIGEPVRSVEFEPLEEPNREVAEPDRRIEPSNEPELPSNEPSTEPAYEPEGEPVGV